MCLVLSGSSVLAQRGEQSVFHEGQVVALTDTEVTIKEWAGTNTYRLRSGGATSIGRDWDQVGGHGDPFCLGGQPDRV